MEELGLLYSAPHNIIICQEHGFALLTPTIKRHLQRFHGAQGLHLQEALDEAYLRAPVLHRDQVLTPPDGLPPVPGLEITPGFQCNFQGCSLEAGGRSANQRTIIRHLKKVHQLPQGSNSFIIEVGLQTFFPSPYKKLFAVSLPALKGTATLIPDSTVATPDGFLQQLESEYKQSHTAQQRAFSAYAIDPALYVSQLPPWLKTTGISSFLERVQLEKPVLTAIVQPLAALARKYFQVCFLLLLIFW